ncbi:hypothetical protein HZH66_010261 [Vespula vulgaris]|uniref:Uncharacterized protein n=1 Tax=Vespula vulgaris TaxID=7454 RepID=A0A834JJ04_VESVU|nr:hypothetical protein HZH66_010261 [Vespula vulgaris]
MEIFSTESRWLLDEVDKEDVARRHAFARLKSISGMGHDEGDNGTSGTTKPLAKKEEKQKGEEEEEEEEEVEEESGRPKEGSRQRREKRDDEEKGERRETASLDD